MSYLNYPTTLEYFNSIPDYGTITPESSNTQYDIKFIYEIKLARLVYKALLVRYPKLNFTFHKTKTDKVIIGGRFPNTINMRKIIFDLRDSLK